MRGVGILKGLSYEPILETTVHDHRNTADCLIFPNNAVSSEASAVCPGGFRQQS